MSSVYVVLRYIYDGHKDTESCQVDRVYTTRKKALKRKKFLERLSLDNDDDDSFHVIEKKLKGNILKLFGA